MPKSYRLHSTPRWSPTRALLEVFFVIHDPTTLDRQGNDVGTQYRSAIFYHSPEQKQVAEQTMRELGAEKVYDTAIVTQQLPAERCYPAEGYRQEYFSATRTSPTASSSLHPR